jgi:hypothetical protein
MNSNKDDIKGILIDNILIKINKLRDDKKKIDKEIIDLLQLIDKIDNKESKESNVPSLSDNTGIYKRIALARSKLN